MGENSRIYNPWSTRGGYMHRYRMMMHEYQLRWTEDAGVCQYQYVKFESLEKTLQE